MNAEQLAAVNAALAKADKWSAWHNCAAFGAAVWNTVCTDKVDPGTPPTPGKPCRQCAQLHRQVEC